MSKLVSFRTTWPGYFRQVAALQRLNAMCWCYLGQGWLAALDRWLPYTVTTTDRSYCISPQSTHRAGHQKLWVSGKAAQEWEECLVTRHQRDTGKPLYRQHIPLQPCLLVTSYVSTYGNVAPIWQRGRAYIATEVAALKIATSNTSTQFHLVSLVVTAPLCHTLFVTLCGNDSIILSMLS